MIGEGFPVVVVQANIDDMNPEIFDHVIDQLFKKGAVDVDLTAIQMKENRPGIKLSAMVPWESKEAIIDVIMTETTTFGVRYYPVERKMLIRDFKKAKISGKDMIFKVGTDADGNVVKIAPEYREVKKTRPQTQTPSNRCLPRIPRYSRKDDEVKQSSVSVPQVKPRFRYTTINWMMCPSDNQSSFSCRLSRRLLIEQAVAALAPFARYSEQMFYMHSSQGRAFTLLRQGVHRR